jgi:1-acyl-sn-glycerol-3-phosphate acyltransferase
VIRFLRTAWRFLLSVGLVVSAVSDFVIRLWLMGRAGSIPARARWLQCWSARFLRILHVRVCTDGQPPQRGILASNHLSYLDILVLGSLHPFVFVAKSDVAGWPIVGRVTRCAGTLYLNRRQKSDVVRLGEEMTRVVEAGVVLVVFLEGTSTDGSEVLPFRSSLLAPAEEHRWPVTGGWIHYSLKDGSVADEVCYWRDMTFGPHFVNLMSKSRIDAHVSFGTPLNGPADRKEMARELHAQVARLKTAYQGAAKAGPPGGGGEGRGNCVKAA